MAMEWWLTMNASNRVAAVGWMAQMIRQAWEHEGAVERKAMAE